MTKKPDGTPQTSEQTRIQVRVVERNATASPRSDSIHDRPQSQPVQLGTPTTRLARPSYDANQVLHRHVQPTEPTVSSDQPSTPLGQTSESLSAEPSGQPTPSPTLDKSTDATTNVDVQDSDNTNANSTIPNELSPSSNPAEPSSQLERHTLTPSSRRTWRSISSSAKQHLATARSILNKQSISQIFGRIFVSTRLTIKNTPQAIRTFITQAPTNLRQFPAKLYSSLRAFPGALKAWYRQHFFPALGGFFLTIAILPFIALGVQAVPVELLPEGDVSPGWPTTTGASHYTEVDEGSATPDTNTYFASDNADNTSYTNEFIMTSQTNIDSATVITVRIYANTTITGSGVDTVTLNARINGTLLGGQNVTPSQGSYAWREATWNGTWSQADIDSLQVSMTRNVVGGGNPTGRGDQIRIATVTTELTYTSAVELEQSSYRWFENQDSTTPSSTDFSKLANPASLPANIGYATDFSPDGKYLAVGHSVSPYITIYEIDSATNTFTKLSNPASLPTGTAQGAAFSPDGNYLSVAHSSLPLITIYEIDSATNTFTKLSDPASLPPSATFGAAFSPDSQYMSVSHGGSPYITIYKIDSATNTFTKLSDPASLPPTNTLGAAFSPDGKYLSTVHGTSPFVTIYEIDSGTDTFTKLTNPSNLPAGTGWGTAFSPDSQYMSVAHNTSPYVTIYEIDSATNTFTKLSDPASLPAGGALGTSFSSEGEYMSVAHNTSPYVTIYEIDSATNTFTKLSDPASLPSGTGRDSAFSSDGQYMSVAHSTSPYVTIYELPPRSADIGASMTTQDTPTEAPAEGTPFRLRASVSAALGDLPADSADLKLQYSELGPDAVCDVGFSGESYEDVDNFTPALEELGYIGKILNAPKAVAIVGDIAYVVNDFGSDSFLTAIDISDVNSLLELDSLASSSFNSLSDIVIDGTTAYVVSSGNDSITSIDISDPNNLVERDTYTDSTNIDFPSGVDVDGTTAYISSLSSDSLTAIDISDPDNLTLQDSISNASMTSAVGVVIDGTTAYVTSSVQDSVTSIDISDPNNLSILDTFVITDLNPRAIAIDGTTAYVTNYVFDSLTSIDVSDPSNMVELDTLASATMASSDGIAISGNTAYVTSDVFESGYLVAFDITDPSNLSEIDAHYSSNLDGANNIAFDGTVAYVTSEVSNTLTAIDVSDPGNMSEIGLLSNVNLNGAISVTIDGTVAYVASFAADSLTAIDISDPSNLAELDSYSNASLDGASSVTIDGTVAYVASYFADSLTAIDISDPSNLAELDSYSSASLVEARSVTIDGTVAYVASYSVDSLTAIDISDPSNLAELDSYSNASLNGAYSVTIDGTVAYVASNIADSLTAIDISTPSNLAELDSYSNASLNGAYSVTIDGTVAYVASYLASSLTSIDISTPSNLAELDSYSNVSSLNGAYSVTADGTVAYVASYSVDSLTAIDISDPSNLAELDSYSNASLNGAISVTIDGTVAYVAGYIAASLTAIDISSYQSLIFHHNSNIPNGAGIAASVDDPNPGSGSKVLQSYVESNNFTNPNTIPNGDYGVWDFALVDNNSPAEATYCFRIVDSSGGELQSYTVIPELSIPPPFITQADYRWYRNAQPLVWSPAVGWIHLGAGGSIGTQVYDDHLEGYAWSENLEWIKLGTYSSGGSHTYANTDQTNYGVNRNSSTGDLSGFGWSPTAGWVNFNPSFGGVNFNDESEEYSGYAWGETFSWIDTDMASGNFLIDETGEIVQSYAPPVSGPFAAQNTRAELEQRNQPVRLRLVLDVSGKDLTTDLADEFKVQYSLAFGDSCSAEFVGENYQDIDGSTTDIRFLTNIGAVDGGGVVADSNDPTSASPLARQTYQQSNPFTNSISDVPVGSVAMFDFAFDDATSGAGLYCFRIVRENGSLIEGYSHIAELFTPPSTPQFLRHGRYFDQGGNARPFFW